MASLETLLWQENYPSEVKAVVCLDWGISRKLFPVEEAPSDVTSSSLGKSIGSVKITAETIIYAQ